MQRSRTPNFCLPGISLNEHTRYHWHGRIIDRDIMQRQIVSRKIYIMLGTVKKMLIVLGY